MPVRRLPVRPDLTQIKHQAKDLQRAVRAGDAEALALLQEHHPHPPSAAQLRLADAQLALARCYQAPSWPRLIQAVQLADAIWEDDLPAVRALIARNPHLLHEHVLVRTDSNWGPPMSYAANLGRDAIIRFLHDAGATDHERAAGRAALQGQVATAQLLYDLAGRPPLPEDALGGPAYTLNADGTAFVLQMGARVVGEQGECLAPVSVVLETDSRKPEAKHAILELYARHGLPYPDAPVMALHRGRLDLLEAHLRRDPGVVHRRFTHREIYPEEMGCRDPLDATVGTPLDGTTLLHMCVEFDEYEIARWLLARGGADPNARATVGASGFGGFTPLFNTIVSMPNFCMNYRGRGPQVAPFTELLLQHGADPNVRASLWKRLHPGHGDSTRHDYRDVTALSWGRRFHDPIFVSEPALALVEAAGGVP
jgi:hypothetical protein